MPLRSVLFFSNCCILFPLLDIYVMVSSSVLRKICMVYFLSVCFLVSRRSFPFFVSVLLLSCVFLSPKLVPPVSYFFFVFSYVFCLISSIVFLSSSVFFFHHFVPKFLWVIAIIHLDISSFSVDIALKLHSFLISTNLLQNFLGVSSSVCFALKKFPQLW